MHCINVSFRTLRRSVAGWLVLTGLLGAVSAASVKVWETDLVIPTYRAGAPEPNPMFYFGRASQGAEGRVYPYPLYDTLTGELEDVTYRVVYLENEYVRVAILPEMGGRLFEGVDKSNGYPFIYRQHVIKPALIGLIGAWISGGVEWNVPHHHRASTFIPVQHRVERGRDGSRTVWVGELELRHRTRWAVGYTLRPGRSVLEAKLRILNRTPVVHTMLCFANVAVHVNENYQVIFPPGTQFVTHHHKRQFTTWPVATTSYGGYDFSQGVDVTWFTNHISANSMFAWNYEDDFFAGYDHGKRAGLMSVANHHIVPGKKLWTWGNGPRGRMWDKILTDEDGPYIELMTGAYSDNQPDYSWLQPHEVKAFSMSWYPFRDIGGVKEANLDAAVNLEVGADRLARVGFHVTAPRPRAVAVLTAGEQVLLEETVSLDPARAWLGEVTLPDGVALTDLRAALLAEGRELVAYSPVPPAAGAMPDPVEAPLAPEKINTVEELYLTGRRIDQFHNPNLDPDPYWEEALRRDPGDSRVNIALGIHYLKRARFAEAEEHLRKALQRLTDKYTTPQEGDPFYYLGLALRAQGRDQEAYDQFYKATWSAAWRSPAYYALAEIATGRGAWDEALDLVDRSLAANALDVRALNLKAAVLRHLGREKEAAAQLEFAAQHADPLDVRIVAERWLLSPNRAATRALQDTLGQHPATAEETASEYFDAGLWQDGVDVLGTWAESLPEGREASPMVYYYLAYFAERLGAVDQAAAYREHARLLPPDYVFPFQWEAIPVLREAMRLQPEDPRAPYYLGNLLFDWQPAEAIQSWERAAKLDPSFPIVHRNLAVAYSHQQTGNALDRAIASLETAVSLPNPYPIHFAELDELYEAAGTRPDKRLALLQAHHDVVAQRDDALAREIGLKVFMGQYDEAIALMTGRSFEVWEGGSLSVADDWVEAHLLRGRQRLGQGDPEAARADFEAAGNIPDNLPSERRGRGAHLAETLFWTGVAWAASGDSTQAKAAWREAAEAERLSQDQRYYQAMCLLRLDQTDRARGLCRDLVQAGQKMRQEESEIDFFASFGKQQTQRAQLAQAHYLTGLGWAGLEEPEKAKEELTRALEISPDHLGAKTALAQLVSAGQP